MLMTDNLLNYGPLLYEVNERRIIKSVQILNIDRFRVKLNLENLDIVGTIAIIFSFYHVSSFYNLHSLRDIKVKSLKCKLFTCLIHKLVIPRSEVRNMAGKGL